MLSVGFSHPKEATGRFGRNFRAGRPVVVLALLAAFCAVLPDSAGATVHSGRIVLEEPETPPSIGEARPAADQRSEYLHEVLARYDAEAGTLTVEVEAWAPAYWGERLSRSFSVGPRCGEEVVPSLEQSTSAALTGYIEAKPYVAPHPIYETPTPVSEPEGGVSSVVVMHGYEGSIHSAGSFNGQRFTVTLGSPAFQGQNWRCVTLDNGLSFKLGGWPAPKKQRHHR
jgi:hypothetical protein